MFGANALRNRLYWTETEQVHASVSQEETDQRERGKLNWSISSSGVLGNRREEVLRILSSPVCLISKRELWLLLNKSLWKDKQTKASGRINKCKPCGSVQIFLGFIVWAKFCLLPWAECCWQEMLCILVARGLGQARQAGRIPLVGQERTERRWSQHPVNWFGHMSPWLLNILFCPLNSGRASGREHFIWEAREKGDGEGETPALFHSLQLYRNK